MECKSWMSEDEKQGARDKHEALGKLAQERNRFVRRNCQEKRDKTLRDWYRTETRRQLDAKECEVPTMPKDGTDTRRISATLMLAREPKMENIWVEKVCGHEYRTLTIPFFAYNLSRGDIVEGHPDEEGIGLFVERVLKKGGNRTVRVGFIGPGFLDHPAGVQLRNYLKEHGLDFEIFNPALLAINVPPEFDYNALGRRLYAIPKEAGAEWEDGDPQPGRNIDGSHAKTRKKAKKSHPDANNS